MYGAILGDIIGSPYEFDRGKKTKKFRFFDRGAAFTDDSVMTIAVADALMSAVSAGVIDNEEKTKDLIIDSMHSWGHRYPNAGYGGRFYYWLRNSERDPYNSWGNGSAMRVSSAGWMFDDLDTTRRIARWTAEVTHNHPEGIKGAESIASAIFLARNGAPKSEIRDYIITEFGYDLGRTCDEIRPGYYHIESCQQTVPEAITAFLEGEDFEDVIRTAVSLGGDCDTLTCIAGSIAEAFYGVPDDLKPECEKRIPPDMRDILLIFHSDRRAAIIAELICRLNENRTKDNFLNVLSMLFSSVLIVPCTSVISERDQQNWTELIEDKLDDLESIVGMILTNKDPIRLVPEILTNGDENYLPVFTDEAEMGEFGDGLANLRKSITDIITLARNNENNVAGIVINAFTDPFILDKDLFDLVERNCRYTVDRDRRSDSSYDPA